MGWFIVGTILVLVGIRIIYSLGESTFNRVAPQKAKEHFWELFWIFSWVGSVFLLIICTFIIECSWWWTIGFGSLVVILFIPAIYFGLAPLNICFTFVNEGTAKAIVAGGAVVEIMYQYNDHVMDASGDIRAVPGAIQPSFLGLGSLRFYGIWPFRRVYDYPFSWASVNQDGDKKDYSERLDYVMIKDTLYWFDVKEAEDSQLLPLNLEGLITVQIVNPYKALFVAQNWLKIMLALVQALFRAEIAEADYEELAAKKRLLGEKFKIDPHVIAVLENLLNSYGINVVKVEVKDIDPPEKYRDLTIKKLVALREKEATIVAAEAEAERTQRVYSAIEKQGDTGRLVRTLEMFEKSKDKWIISADVLEAVRGILGNIGKKGP